MGMHKRRTVRDEQLYRATDDPHNENIWESNDGRFRFTWNGEAGYWECRELFAQHATLDDAVSAMQTRRAGRVTADARI